MTRKKVEVKRLSKSQVSVTTKAVTVKDIAEAIRIVKERGLTKVAHRPRGAFTWVHIYDLPSETRDAISLFLTENPGLTIHQLAQVALEVYLRVPIDARTPQAESWAKKAKLPVNDKGGELGARQTAVTPAEAYGGRI